MKSNQTIFMIFIADFGNSKDNFLNMKIKIIIENSNIL